MPNSNNSVQQDSGKGQEEINLETTRAIVKTAGTAVKVTEIYNGHCATIWADDGNAGDIYIGNRNVRSTKSIILAPGATVEIDLSDGIEKNKYIVVYADAANDGDSVRWIKL